MGFGGLDQYQIVDSNRVRRLFNLGGRRNEQFVIKLKKLRISVHDGWWRTIEDITCHREEPFAVVHFDFAVSSRPLRQSPSDEYMQAPAGWAYLGVAVQPIHYFLGFIVDSAGIRVDTVIEVDPGKLIGFGKHEPDSREIVLAANMKALHQTFPRFPGRLFWQVFQTLG